MKKYLSQPLDFDALMSGNKDPGCSFVESIKQRLLLILVTHFGEFRADPKFGCIIWNHDFVTVPNVDSWKNEMKKETEKALKNYEKRLSISQVDLEIKPKNNTYKIEVKIKARIIKTNDLFEYYKSFFISPMRLEDKS